MQKNSINNTQIEFQYIINDKLKRRWTYKPVGYKSDKPFTPEFESFMDAVKDAEAFGYDISRFGYWFTEDCFTKDKKEGSI